MNEKNMRRKIRFRFWNENLTLMITWEEACREFNINNFFKEDSAYLPMQNTGEKFENEEIYEYDILEDPYGDRWIVKNGEYDNNESYEDNISGNGWYMENIKNQKVGNLESWKIVGNIFQNKDIVS